MLAHLPVSYACHHWWLIPGGGPGILQKGACLFPLRGIGQSACGKTYVASPAWKSTEKWGVLVLFDMNNRIFGLYLAALHRIPISVMHGVLGRFVHVGLRLPPCHCWGSAAGNGQMRGRRQTQLAFVALLLSGVR
jgi:hypothetical protein